MGNYIKKLKEYWPESNDSDDIIWIMVMKLEKSSLRITNISKPLDLMVLVNIIDQKCLRGYIWYCLSLEKCNLFIILRGGYIKHGTLGKIGIFYFPYMDL